MSYGMARVYPSAGSAYTYVGRELIHALGTSPVGSMTLDYIVRSIDSPPSGPPRQWPICWA